MSQTLRHKDVGNDRNKPNKHQKQSHRYRELKRISPSKEQRLHRDIGPSIAPGRVRSFHVLSYRPNHPPRKYTWQDS
jgi:hypothetical protein